MCKIVYVRKMLLNGYHTHLFAKVVFFYIRKKEIQFNFVQANESVFPASDVRLTIRLILFKNT